LGQLVAATILRSDIGYRKVANAMQLEQAQQHFCADHCFLNTATVGLGPRFAAQALAEDLIEWTSGNIAPLKYDDLVDRSRIASRSPRLWALATPPM